MLIIAIRLSADMANNRFYTLQGTLMWTLHILKTLANTTDNYVSARSYVTGMKRNFDYTLLVYSDGGIQPYIYTYFSNTIMQLS